VPEIRLHLADEAHELWLKTEEELDALGLPPPFWAFAWAGGQGLARHILDNPDLVAGKHGARFRHRIGPGGDRRLPRRRSAGECRRHRSLVGHRSPAQCRWPTTSNSKSANPMLSGTDAGWDVVLAGDVFYDRAMSDLVQPWFSALAKRGALVLVGDPGRAYCPNAGLNVSQPTRCR
jgi:predicted nicotinamide N-methyase